MAAKINWHGYGTKNYVTVTQCIFDEQKKIAGEGDSSL